MTYVCICMFLQKLVKLNYCWFIIIVHIPVLKKNTQPCSIQSVLLSLASYQLRVAKPFQPSIHRAPWDRSQVLEHLLPHIRHTPLTITDAVLWALRAAEQLQESVLWVIPVFIVKCKWVPFNPMILTSAELPDRAYPKLSIACAIGI